MTAGPNKRIQSAAIAFVVLAMHSGFGHSAPKAVAKSSQHTEPRAIEISSLDVDWSKEKPPPEVLKSFKNLWPGDPEDPESQGDTGINAVSGIFRVDLDGDGVKEIIGASRDFPSGGRIYLIFAKRKGKWRSIGLVQGGFNLSFADNANTFYMIDSYYRSGDTYQNTFIYSRGRYRLARSTKLPRALTNTCWWHAFWTDFNSPSGLTPTHDTRCCKAACAKPSAMPR